VFVIREQMFYCEVGTEILDIISMNCKLQNFNFLKDDIQETYPLYWFYFVLKLVMGTGVPSRW
jgi:hypothetical protein